MSGLSSLSVVSRFIHVACISASFLVLFFLKIYLSFIWFLFIFYSLFYLFVVDCAGGPLLRVGLLQLW